MIRVGRTVIVLDMERIVRQVAARYESSLYLHESGKVAVILSSRDYDTQ